MRHICVSYVCCCDGRCYCPPRTWKRNMQQVNKHGGWMKESSLIRKWARFLPTSLLPKDRLDKTPDPVKCNLRSSKQRSLPSPLVQALLLRTQI
jgi:hypothetical protein